MLREFSSQPGRKIGVRLVAPRAVGEVRPLQGPRSPPGGLPEAVFFFNTCE